MDPDPEFGKFKAGSGINHSGSATLLLRIIEEGLGICQSFKPDGPRDTGSLLQGEEAGEIV